MRDEPRFLAEPTWSKGLFWGLRAAGILLLCHYLVASF